MNFSIVGFRGKIFGAMLIAACAANIVAQEIPPSISGTVKDSSTQAPIAGAFITLLSNPEMAAMSDADGKFTLLLYDPAGINPGRAALKGMQLRGTDFSFSVSRSERVRVSLHDLRGRQVAVLKDARLPAGEYTMSAAPAGLRPGLYLLRAAIGGQSRSFKVSTLGGSRSYFGRAVSSPRALAKAAIGGVDWIVVAKDGYLKKSFEIMAYADAQNVALDASKPATAKLAIFTDSTYPQIDWANAAIYAWESTSTLLADSSGAGFNGSKVSMKVSVTETAPGWNGWAFHVGVLANGKQPTVDLTPYKDGALHLAVKGTAKSIGVMLSSTNQGPGSAPLVDLAAKGYLPDDAWHEITVPMSEFAGSLNLADVFVYCGFVSPSVQFAEFDPLGVYAIDDVYFTPAP